MDEGRSEMLCHSVTLEINGRFYASSLPENGCMIIRKQHTCMWSRRIPVLLPKNSRECTKLFSDIQKEYVTTKKISQFLPTVAKLKKADIFVCRREPAIAIRILTRRYTLGNCCCVLWFVFLAILCFYWFVSGGV